MGLDNPKAGMNYAVEFQCSALPYITSSIAPVSVSGSLSLSFPKITKYFQVSNHSATGNYLRIGFSRNGVALNNYFLVDGKQSQVFDLRIKQLFFAGHSGSVDFSVCAGLTNIDASMMSVLTGTLPGSSYGWDGVG